MVEDDVLLDVRAARDAYARAHGYDVQAMVADLRARYAAGPWQVVRRAPRRPGSVVAPAVAPEETTQPTFTN